MILCTPWPFGLGKKVMQTLNCADKYNLIELSDLIKALVMIRVIPKMDLSVGEREIYFVVNILS